jgi:nicotinate phosphoribosyltransferase
MGVAAIEGYEGSNGRAMDLWEKVTSISACLSRDIPFFLTVSDRPIPMVSCPSHSPIRSARNHSLSKGDGAGSRERLPSSCFPSLCRDYIADPERAKRWNGIRQDSGDPDAFISLAKKAFLRVGADPSTSTWSFSFFVNGAQCNQDYSFLQRLSSFQTRLMSKRLSSSRSTAMRRGSDAPWGSALL